MFDNIEVITVAKVASATLFYAAKTKYKNAIHHHSLLDLKDTLQNKKNILIIIGVRNPITRNVSYIIANHGIPRIDIKYAVKAKKINNYNGEDSCYISPENRSPISKFIQEYFKLNIHNTYNYWFQELFEITGIDKKTFDKKKGLDFYDFPNNNKILIYTVEKLKDNMEEIYKFCNIDGKYTKNYNIRCENELYKNLEENIKYSKSYIDSLLNTDIIRFFYDTNDIKKFYNEINYDYKVNNDIDKIKDKDIKNKDTNNILLNHDLLWGIYYNCYIYHNNKVKFILPKNEYTSTHKFIYYPNNKFIIKIDKILGNNGNLDFNMQIFGIKYIIDIMEGLSVIVGKLNVDSNLPLKIFTGSKWIHHNKPIYDDTIEITNIDKWRISPSNEFLQNNIGKTDIKFIINTISFQF